MNKWPTNSQQRLVQNDVVLARQFKKKKKREVARCTQRAAAQQPFICTFHRTPSVHEQRCNFSSFYGVFRRPEVRLHRSATTLVCSVVLLLYNEWTMSSYRRLILTVGMRCSSLMWVYSIGA
ncbi:unnamed protein product [Prunus armeniaca]